MFVDNPNHKGNVAELAIAKEAASLGLSVLAPLTEHERYDLALGIGGRLQRVQCKWGSHQGGVVQVRLRSSYHSPTRGYVVTTYGGSEVDLVGVYCGELDRCYLVPVALFAGRTTLHLRLDRTKNNQRAALNWAADYEFRGAVAQLAERSNGIREAEGSNPSSSTSAFKGAVALNFPDPDDFADLKHTVGMDEFYAKLAQYVRLAESGQEVHITRWGKPVARLASIATAAKSRVSPAPRVSETDDG
jgi:prevent-host-death family protein